MRSNESDQLDSNLTQIMESEGQLPPNLTQISTLMANMTRFQIGFVNYMLGLSPNLDPILG